MLNSGSDSDNSGPLPGNLSFEPLDLKEVYMNAFFSCIKIG